MEHIILGLLLLQPRTIYELRKRIDEGLNLMYSCSTGSIQAALKKLLNGGYICVTEVTQSGKRKKVYAVTDAGKLQFKVWVNSAMESGSAKNPELAKIYFMGFAGKDSRIKSIEKLISELQKTYSALQKICEEGESMLTQTKDNDILFYQLQTAKYGCDFMRFNIEWYTRLLKDMGERK